MRRSPAHIKSRRLFIAAFLFVGSSLFAQVKYDEGRIQIDGIQLLQDSKDENAYYYLTRFISLSTKKDGAYELLCIKYVGEGEETSGGLFHALFEFSLPSDRIETTEAKLKKQLGKEAYIAGPVPVRQAVPTKTGETGRFEVISSVLTQTKGENPFTSSIITSGYAPLLPGSKAAIAARLSPSGATLLWESLSGKTSDVSVSIHGYYEARVKGYNAIISAEAETVYNHYSQFSNKQKGYTREQLRKISDEMIQNQIIKVDVSDHSKGLNMDTKKMQAIVDLVTDKLIDLMFNAKTGWVKAPETEAAAEPGKIAGRLLNAGRNARYITENQYIIKQRKDIRLHKFYLNLSSSTVIKVPVYTSGNISGLYEVMKDDERYFKIVNLADADFQKREIHFQIDGGCYDAFDEIINSVSVSFRKSYGEGEAPAVSNFLFTRKDLMAGNDFKTVIYPRLGAEGKEWLHYEYKLSYNIKGDTHPITLPKEEGLWQPENASLVTLELPFKKRIIDIDVDRDAFKEAGIRSVTVRFFTVLNGKPGSQNSLVIRENDTENTLKTHLYYDEGEIPAYQVIWYGKKGRYEEKIRKLQEDYLFLIPPSAKAYKN